MKVTYFDLYARAEPIRMMLWKAGVEFEDERLDHTGADGKWPEMKPNTPHQCLPIITLDDGY